MNMNNDVLFHKSLLPTPPLIASVLSAEISGGVNINENVTSLFPKVS